VRPFANHPDELISASLTGDVTPLERRELEAHLIECAQCRATLDSFREQRNLLGALAQPEAPRDLGARVRAGIQSGRFGTPWWRRPGGLLAAAASLATVGAAAVLAVLLLGISPSRPPVAASFSASPSSLASASPVVSPSPEATPPALPLGLKPGDLLYTTVSGDIQALKLRVVRAASGAAVTPSSPDQINPDQVKRAALSPDGQVLAFAMETGQKGTWRIFATELSSGTTSLIAETFPTAFGRRLLWSPDGRYLAFTVANPSGMTDAWLYDRQTSTAQPVTKDGNAYAASWSPVTDAKETLWISLAASDPTTVATSFPVDGGIPAANLTETPLTKVDGVFEPLISPDGQSALFWRGTMGQAADQGWTFSVGGLPQLTTNSSGGVPSWDSGAALFADLVPGPNGEAFASGDVTWAQDSDTLAFWAGMWTAPVESQGAAYPDGKAVYAGRASAGPLTKKSALDLGKMTEPNGDQVYVVDVALSSDGTTAAVTLGIPLAGELSTPKSYLRLSSIGTNEVKAVDGASPQPWLGPGVYVP
jgi:Putative zinc-finger/WD40-like Beta Propeller Repeat